jgi:4-amino-4-deoxy-L-arabinose transferase-like glycosyltransferase
MSDERIHPVVVSFARLARPSIFIPHPSSLILSLLCFALFLQGISARGLWASHEARAAQNGQRMLDDGDWLLPRLYDGQVELQKPPGYYWLVAAVGAIRGRVDAVAVRSPAVFAGLIAVLLVWWHLHKRGRPVSAFVAGAMLAGAAHFTGTARIGRIDVPLASVVTAIMLVSRDCLAATRSLRSGARDGDPATARAPLRKASASRLHLFAIGILGGCALLLKGPIGIVLPVAAIFVRAIIERCPIHRLIVPALIATSISLAIAVPWYLWANAATGGEFFRVFFVYHHFNRAFGGAEALAGHPFWFYFPRFAADFLPWTLLLLIALVLRRWRGDADARFGIVWFVVMLAVLSCSRFKRADYLLPAYPGAAIFLGCAVERWYQVRTVRTRRWLAIIFVVVLVFLPAWWFAFDRVVTAKDEATRDHSAFAGQVRAIAPAPGPIVLFQVESHQLAFHLGRPVHTLVEWGDLDALLRESGPHYAVIPAGLLNEFPHAEVVARSEDLVSVPQQRPLILLRLSGTPCPTPPRD